VCGASRDASEKDLIMGNRQTATNATCDGRNVGTATRYASSRVRRAARGFTAGFTLVEILIVVVILGIMATIVIPQFSNASHQARENTLKDDLRYLRVQIQVYKAQHNDVAPGYPGGDRGATPTEADFIEQMTKYTSATGAVSATPSTVYKYGPYLSGVPENPLTHKTKITVVAGSGALTAPTTDDGWLYQPDSQKLIANMTGADGTGVNYADY
jgi:general secretion pathway protein G